MILVPVSELPYGPAASIAASEAGQIQHPEIGYMTDPPTRDFLHGGVPDLQKTESCP
jgi:hypothetical protein